MWRTQLIRISHVTNTTDKGKYHASCRPRVCIIHVGQSSIYDNYYYKVVNYCRMWCNHITELKNFKKLCWMRSKAWAIAKTVGTSDGAWRPSDNERYEIGWALRQRDGNYSGRHLARSSTCLPGAQRAAVLNESTCSSSSRQKLWSRCSLVPRPLPCFQSYTLALKRERAGLVRDLTCTSSSCVVPRGQKGHFVKLPVLSYIIWKEGSLVR
jgi:hypothetical protein